MSQNKDNIVVGSKVKLLRRWLDGDIAGFRDGMLVVGGVYTIDNIDTISPCPAFPDGRRYHLKDILYCVPPEMIELVLDQPPFPWKINVRAYADEHSIPIDKANKEIQLQLFELSEKIHWMNVSGQRALHYNDTPFLYVEAGGLLKRGFNLSTFDDCGDYHDIKFTRAEKVDVAPIWPAMIRKKVNIDGRIYYLDEVQKSLAGVQPIGCVIK